MSSKFCYHHHKIALKIGEDSYRQPVYYCEKGKHYLLHNGEPRRHVNLNPNQNLESRLKQ